MLFYELKQYNSSPTHPRLRQRIIQRAKGMIGSGHCIVIGVEGALIDWKSLDLLSELPEDKIKIPNPYEQIS